MKSVTFPPSLKPGIWGAVIGAAAMSVLGFSIFGWTLRDTAERIAREQAQTAVVDALAPICVERFRQQPDAPAKLKEFAKAMTWDQRSIIEKGGWATMPGAEARIVRLPPLVRSGLAARCRTEVSVTLSRRAPICPGSSEEIGV